MFKLFNESNISFIYPFIVEKTKCKSVVSNVTTGGSNWTADVQDPLPNDINSRYVDIFSPITSLLDYNNKISITKAICKLVITIGAIPCPPETKKIISFLNIHPDYKLPHISNDDEIKEEDVKTIINFINLLIMYFDHDSLNTQNSKVNISVNNFPEEFTNITLTSLINRLNNGDVAGVATALLQHNIKLNTISVCIEFSEKYDDTYMSKNITNLYNNIKDIIDNIKNFVESFQGNNSLNSLEDIMDKIKTFDSIDDNTDEVINEDDKLKNYLKSTFPSSKIDIENGSLEIKQESSQDKNARKFIVSGNSNLFNDIKKINISIRMQNFSIEHIDELHILGNDSDNPTLICKEGNISNVGKASMIGANLNGAMFKNNRRISFKNCNVTNSEFIHNVVMIDDNNKITSQVNFTNCKVKIDNNNKINNCVFDKCVLIFSDPETKQYIKDNNDVVGCSYMRIRPSENVV